MAERVVLHIGTMKSGTTYLQGALSGGGLEGTGAFYVGGRFGAQTSAVRALLRPTEQRRPRPWLRLAAEAVESEGVAVFSQEFLSFAGRPRIAQIIDSFAGVPVEVVLTVRDQHGALPAQWQSFTRNRGVDDWARYLRRLERATSGGRGGSKAVRSFRRAQNVPGILGRWTEQPGLERTTVVVVPPAGSPPNELWRRFCEATRIRSEDPPTAAAKSNESLGYASCDALRRVNANVGELSKAQYTRARRQLLEALLPLRPQEERPQLDRAGAALARDLNRNIRDALEARGVALVGSLEELPVDDDGRAPAEVPEPDQDQVRRALAAAWEGAVHDEDPPRGRLDTVAVELGRRLVARHAR